jgi:hypothetical protein
MGEKLLENVRAFKYLGFHWTDKLSLALTVNPCLEKIQRSYIKLKWLKRNRHITTEVFRTCFFSYSFPFSARLFPFFPMLPKTYQEVLKSKFRVGIRIIHRRISISASDLFTLVKELRLEEYVAAYLKKRLLNMHKSDLGDSLFEDEGEGEGEGEGIRVRVKSRPSPSPTLTLNKKSISDKMIGTRKYIICDVSMYLTNH